MAMQGKRSHCRTARSVRKDAKSQTLHEEQRKAEQNAEKQRGRVRVTQIAIYTGHGTWSAPRSAVDNRRVFGGRVLTSVVGTVKE